MITIYNLLQIYYHTQGNSDKESDILFVNLVFVINYQSSKNGRSSGRGCSFNTFIDIMGNCGQRRLIQLQTLQRSYRWGRKYGHRPLFKTLCISSNNSTMT